MTLLRPEQHDLTDEKKLKSCGTPLPLTELRVAGPDGQDLPVGSVGEFWLRAPSMFGGYWNQPEVTAAAIVDGCTAPATPVTAMPKVFSTSSIEPRT